MFITELYAVYRGALQKVQWSWLHKEWLGGPQCIKRWADLTLNPESWFALPNNSATASLRSEILVIIFVFVVGGGCLFTVQSQCYSIEHASQASHRVKNSIDHIPSHSLFSPPAKCCSYKLVLYRFIIRRKSCCHALCCYCQCEVCGFYKLNRYM